MLLLVNCIYLIYSGRIWTESKRKDADARLHGRYDWLQRHLRLHDKIEEKRSMSWEDEELKDEIDNAPFEATSSARRTEMRADRRPTCNINCCESSIIAQPHTTIRSLFS